jgi:hypothetical protein
MVNKYPKVVETCTPIHLITKFILSITYAQNTWERDGRNSEVQKLNVLVLEQFEVGSPIRKFDHE